MDSITPNEKNLKNRSDYGVRVARPGYDANLCAQNQLLFNSGWPIMQIVKVIELSNANTTYVYELTTTETKFDLVNQVVLSQKETVSEVDSPPAGYTYEYTYQFDASSLGIRSIQVNSKYIRELLSGTRTSYTYPTEVITEGNIRTSIGRMCEKMPIRKKTHNVGYTPLFLESGNISNISGYIVMFSIDITTDIDYPYTERSLELTTPTNDYGIKSTSEYGSRVPGLCSNMFSKLVQAVKTEETSTWEGYAVWSPAVDKVSAEEGCLLPFEFLSYVGNSNNNAGINGGVYYYRDYPFYISKGNVNDGFGDGWAVATTATQAAMMTKNSLVVLRSPMTSPVYEERTI